MVCSARLLDMKPSKFSLRKAVPEDAAGILKCLAEAFAPFREQYTPEGFRDTTLSLETIPQRLATMSVYVAVDTTAAIIGTIGCSVSHEEGHIRGMAVRPEWQGAQVAGALLAAVERELLNQGCSRITLDTTRPLQRAIRFYERHGYRASGRVSDFFGMPLLEYAKVLRSKEDLV